MKFVESYYRIIGRDNCYLGITENVSSNFSLVNKRRATTESDWKLDRAAFVSLDIESSAITIDESSVDTR